MACCPLIWSFWRLDPWKYDLNVVSHSLNSISVASMLMVSGGSSLRTRTALSRFCAASSAF